MIKKLVTLAALAMLLGSPSSYADFFPGNKLVELCDESNIYNDGVCAGYVIGISDRINGEVACIPDGVTSGQAVSIVKKYLKKNPEELHYTAHSLVAFALIKAFPCNN